MEGAPMKFYFPGLLQKVRNKLYLSKYKSIEKMIFQLNLSLLLVEKAEKWKAYKLLNVLYDKRSEKGDGNDYFYLKHKVVKHYLKIKKKNNELYISCKKQLDQIASLFSSGYYPELSMTQCYELANLLQRNTWDNSNESIAYGISKKWVESFLSSIKKSFDQGHRDDFIKALDDSDYSFQDAWVRFLGDPNRNKSKDEVFLKSQRLQLVSKATWEKVSSCFHSIPQIRFLKNDNGYYESQSISLKVVIFLEELQTSNIHLLHPRIIQLKSTATSKDLHEKIQSILTLYSSNKLECRYYFIPKERKQLLVEAILCYSLKLSCAYIQSGEITPVDELLSYQNKGYILVDTKPDTSNSSYHVSYRKCSTCLAELSNKMINCTTCNIVSQEYVIY